jgi:hypothetical protein
MPDGTLLRGIPDGVSREDIQAHYIEKLGQERWDAMTGGASPSSVGADEPVATPSPESTSAASASLREIAEREGREPTMEEVNQAVLKRRTDAGLPPRPADQTKYSNPYQEKLGSTSPEGADIIEQTQAADPDLSVDLGPEGKEKSAALRKDAEPVVDEDKLTPHDLQVEIQGAAKTAEYNREYAEQMGDEDMPFAARINTSPREAAAVKTKKFVNSGRYTAEELGISQGTFDMFKNEAKPVQTREEIQKQQKRDEYYALKVANPELAKQMMPEIHEEETSGPELAPESDVSLEGRPDDTVWNWMAHTGTSVTESMKSAWEGFKMSHGSGVRKQGALRQLAGQRVLETAAEQYADLSEENKRIVREAASRQGKSPDEMIKDAYSNFLEAAVDEAGSLQAVAEQQSLMQASAPKSASTTKLGYYADQIAKNSGQIGIIMTGMITGSPMVAASLFGTYVYGQTYAGRRMEGKTHEEAQRDGAVTAIMEGLTELIPVNKAIDLIKVGKKGKGKIRKWTEIGVTEFAQETFMEAFQMGYDFGIYDETVTPGEAFQRMLDAGIVGLAIGTVMATPALVAQDTVMTNANEKIAEAKKELLSLNRQIQNPDKRVSGEAVKAAKDKYVDAVKAKRKIVIERKKEEVEKKKAKQEKKEEKRKAKLTPLEREREAAVREQEAKPQDLTEPVTEEDLAIAETIGKAQAGELGEEDAEVVSKLLDLGYMKISKAGTPMVLDAGARRKEAIEAGYKPVLEGEVIQPTPVDTPEMKRRREARESSVDEEIGRLIRGEPEPEIIVPKPYTPVERRKAKIAARVREDQADIADKIADAIVREEQRTEAYEQKEQVEAAQKEQDMNADYRGELDRQADVDEDAAYNLARLDPVSQKGYKGTKLGKVLRRAMKRIEQEEQRARDKVDTILDTGSIGVVYDIGEVLQRGTRMYANVVKIGALKLTKYGAKYGAWAADMVGEFGDSIRPVLAQVYHDAKKNVANVMKWSHEKFVTGERKGELKFAAEQYSKPGAIRKLRVLLKGLAMEGEKGKRWYEKSGRIILNITGGVATEARKLAGLLAIYSSGTSVAPNLTNAMKMWAIYQGRKKVKRPKSGTLAGRFGKQDKLALEWLESDASDEHFVELFGDKRFPFFTNLMRAVDPETYEYGQGVTIDLWMMRALGYDTPAPTAPQTAFGAVEIRLLADKLGWERQQTQAAVWVAIKARWEYVTKKARDRAVKLGYAEWGVGPKGKPTFDILGNTRDEQIENEKKIVKLFRKEALAASITEMQDKLDESARDFEDYMQP